MVNCRRKIQMKQSFALVSAMEYQSDKRGSQIFTSVKNLVEFSRLGNDCN